MDHPSQGASQDHDIEKTTELRIQLLDKPEGPSLRPSHATFSPSRLHSARYIGDSGNLEPHYAFHPLMPRLATSLLRKAYTIDPLLPSLLGPCRELRAAQNELKWLREHVGNVARARRARGDSPAKGALLKRLVYQRKRGTPLQYLLGTEFFGELEIRCKPGVLIPRQDTATAVTHLTRLVRSAPKLPNELRVLDLCTGTGCIPLLFQHEFCSTRKDVQLRSLAVDISKKALNLARHNRRLLRKQQAHSQNHIAQFLHADVLSNPLDWDGGALPFKMALNWKRAPPFWDILVSNPPYISPQAYWKTTSRSVRGFEPRLALVPPEQQGRSDEQQGDAFYPRLLAIARDVEAKVVLLEVADVEQAYRVAQMARRIDLFDGIEIWRDEPAAAETTSSNGFAVVGQGNGRSVVCWRGVGGQWLGKSSTPKKTQRFIHSLDSVWL